MSTKITLEQFQRWLLLYARRIAEQEAYLTELDAAIGDADHGINMHRGMQRVYRRLAAANPGLDLPLADGSPTTEDIGALFRTVAMTLISSVGGAAGPLYGAFFLWAAKEAAGKQEVTLAQLSAMLHHGLEGVQQRGKAHRNEKTMLDAIAPALEALQEAVDQDAPTAQALAQAAAAAATGMEHTIKLQATKGRASYLGARSIGHMDPGAASAFMLFQAAAETLGQIDEQSSQASSQQASSQSVAATSGNR